MIILLMLMNWSHVKIQFIKIPVMMMRFRIECRNEDCGVGAGNIRTQSAFGFVSISCNSHETPCPNQSFINFKRTSSYFSLPVERLLSLVFIRGEGGRW